MNGSKVTIFKNNLKVMILPRKYGSSRKHAEENSTAKKLTLQPICKVFFNSFKGDYIWMIFSLRFCKIL